MQKKSIIIMSMIAVIVLAVTLLIVQFSDTKQEKAEKTGPNNNKVESIVSKNTEEENCQTVGQEDESKEEENCQTVGQANENNEESENAVEENYAIEQENASGREPQSEDIQRVNVNIVDMKDEVKAQIKDMQAFEYAIKEFFYKAGIVQEEVKCLNKITSDYQDRNMIYQMYVRSNAVTFFEVVYDMNTNTFSVLY